MTDSLSVKKALWWVGVHSNFACWQVNSVRRFCCFCKVLDEFPVVSYMSPRNACTCFGILVVCMFLIACVFNGSGFMPFVLSICPRYWISFMKKWHLLSFMDKCACFLASQKPVLCGLDVLLLFYWKWWCCPSKQWQSWNPSIFLS